MTSRESSAPQDSALLAAVGAADETAFLQLYDRFSKPLYSLLLKMLQSVEDAEDALQSTFVQVWKKAETYDPNRCAVFTWLVLIARSKAIDRLRQRQRQSRNEEALLGETKSNGAEETEDATVQLHENAAAIRAALQQIPIEQREAIEMAFFKGLSQTEISEALKEPLGTVKARIRRGMLKLRDYLARRL